MLMAAAALMRIVTDDGGRHSLEVAASRLGIDLDGLRED